MPAAKTSRSYYPALDGLRGIAILLVIFLHNFKFTNYFFFGWLGVDLFFVLSGFLITGILIQTMGQPNFLRNFYMRRVLRIFPVYYLTLIICLLILPRISSLNVQADYYTDNQVWLWTYLQNWLYIFKPPYGDVLLLHTWSLAVEEQFYLIWPVIIFFVRKPKVLLALATVTLVLTGIGRYLIWSLQVEDLAYASLFTFTRIDGLCIGSMLALLMVINPGFLKKYTTWIVLLMAAINFGFFFLNNQRSFSLPYLAFAGYTSFAVLFGILVHEAVTAESKIIRVLLDNRFLKFFGRISYGLYVYHMPLFVILFPLLTSWLGFTSLQSGQIEIISASIATIAAVFIAYISYHLFEKKFLRLKNRF